MPCFNECRPEWSKLARTQELLDRQVLERFSKACQEAGVDELAVARQVLVARRGRDVSSDQPLISAGLRRLAPGPQTEAVIRRLAEPGLTGAEATGQAGVTPAVSR